MELVSPPKVTVSLLKGDTDATISRTQNGYYEVINDTTLMFHSNADVNTYTLPIPRFADKFTFWGGSTFIESGEITSAEFIFLDASGGMLYHWKQDDILLSYKKEFDIPVGANRILAPGLTSMTNFMRFSYANQEVTDGVINLEDLKVQMSRDGVTAVFVSSQMPIQFARKSLGWQMIVDEFMSRGIRGDIKMTVSQRSPYADPDYEYTPIISAPIDFTTYEQHRDYVGVECVDASLNQLIQALGNADYDIPVSDIAANGEDLQWQDVGLLEYAQWGLPVEEEIEIGDNMKSPVYYSMAMTLENTRSIPGSVENDIKPQTGARETKPGAETYFFKAAADTSITIKANINISLSAAISSKIGNHEGWLDMWKSGLGMYLRIYNGGTRILAYSPKPTWSIAQSGNQYMATARVQLNIDQQFDVSEGDVLSICFYCEAPILTIDLGPAGDKYLYTSFFARCVSASFSITYDAAFPPETSKAINVINPQTLLQKFLDLMSGQEGKYTAIIDWGIEWQEKRIRLAAAESIAHYRYPYFHGNLKDFMNWMRIMGYEYSIVGNTIEYGLRSTFFVTLNAIDITAAQLADLKISPATDVLFSSVKAGYEAQNYDDEYLSGLEANGTCIYSTGIESLDGEMDLISPYRGDAIGIQTLYRKLRTEDSSSTTDERNDPNSDVFVVVMNGASNTMDMTTPIEVYDDVSETYVQFPNGDIAPPKLVAYNADVIGISTNKLKFTSTDGAKSATIGGVPIGSDIEITQQLFKPLLYEFEAGAGKDFPVTTGVLSKFGSVRFDWQGQTLRGFVKEVSCDVIDSEATTWELYAIDTPEA